MDAPWFSFVLAAFATWRMAQLLVRDDGPWDLMHRLRRGAGDGAFGRMLDCFNCASLWCALPLAFAVARGPMEWLLAWLGLAGVACLLDRLVHVPLVVQRWDERGEDHELLRAETRRVAGASDAVGAAAVAAGPAEEHHADGTPRHVVQ